MFESEEKETVRKKCSECSEEFDGLKDKRNECPNCGSSKIYKLGE